MNSSIIPKYKEYKTNDLFIGEKNKLKGYENPRD